MNDSLRNAFMVEVKDFLPEMKILQRSTPANSYFQRILIVCYWHSLLGSQRRNIPYRDLVGLTALSPHNPLIAQLSALALAVGPFGRHVGSSSAD